MSRFVRASKYRHVFGQPAKGAWHRQPQGNHSAWDTTSSLHLVVNWNSSGGGAFAILPAPSPSTGSPGIPAKLPDIVPLARSHTARAGPARFAPVLRIDASPRKVGQVLWHPAAQHVLASALGDHTVKLWDPRRARGPTRRPAGPRGYHTEHRVQPDRPAPCHHVPRPQTPPVRPRAGGDAVRVGEGHGGIKGHASSACGDALKNVRTLTLDQSAGVVMPFWSDNTSSSSGDGNIRYYEYENDNLYALDEHKSSDPQRGITSDCEIARAYKLTISAVEPIAFIVPRKSDSFQSDIFPPAPSIEPSLSAGEFFTGKPISLKLVSLETGAVSTTAASSIPPPTRTATASSPVPASAPAPPPAALSLPLAPPITKPADPQPLSPQLPPYRSTSSIYVP
ncbi:microtubule binding protein, partial [Lactarius hengduanensis]